MKKWISKNKTLLIFLVASLLPVIFLGSGSPFKYDWWWPVFDMKQFWDGLIGNSLQGLFSSLSKNGPAIFGVFGLINFPPSILFRIFIFVVHFTAGYGFYKFIRTRVKSEIVAVVSGLAYAFSPYIFIRTIVGFTWSMVAYAVLPIFLLKFWQPKKKVLDYIIIGFLFSLIFCQTQAGLLTLLIITVYSVVGLFGKSRVFAIKNYFLTIISLMLFALPWLVAMLFKEQSTEIVSGGAVTTLNFIAGLPHSFRNFFMLSDHHITSTFFYALSRDKLFLLGWLIVWFVVFCTVFNRKNRELTLTFIISCSLVLPFIKGPLGIFGKFYVWFFNHISQVAVFRETYHFEFLLAISLCVMFAVGLDWLWNQIGNLKLSVVSCQLSVLIKTGLKTLFAGSAIFIITPYLSFDYAGYSPMRKISSEYNQLYNYFQSNKDVCHKIYYPPGLGYIYFEGDNSGAASNSDVIASSLDIPYLTDGTSVLNLPSDEMYYRNELVSQFYEKNDNEGFAALLNEGNIDCVVLRLDTETRYPTSSNLWQEKDPVIAKKWNQNDWLSMIKTKKGLALEKQFGENIYIYKIDATTKLPIDRNYEITNRVGNPAMEQFSNRAIVSLQLTDWANVNSYYKDGWSRGRYDFWRKLLLTQLRQDFIYTDKDDSVLTGKIDYKGEYEVWTRCLVGGAQGSYQLSVNSYQYVVTKDTGEEKFVWKKVGDVKLDGETNIEIKNISGENAIADLVLVKQ